MAVNLEEPLASRYDVNNVELVTRRAHIFKKEEIDLIAETIISKLQNTTQNMLSKCLTGRDKEVERLDRKGVRIINNYKGVGELGGIGTAALNAYESPVLDLLKEMGEKQLTILDLVNILICIQRRDVVKDCRANILSDCCIYSEWQKQRMQMLALNESEYDDDYSSEKKNQTWPFVAFICSAMADLRYARHLVDRIERTGLNVFYPERDLLPGSPVNSVNAFFIEERCKHVIVILSEAFSRSPECLFQLKFTNALDPAARAMKIIPVKFEESAPVPRTLNFITLCDMRDGGWSKLERALKSQHRVKKEVLEQISYPQHHSFGGQQNTFVKTSTENQDRVQPEGQEVYHPGKAASNDLRTTPVRRLPKRSQSAPIETTV